MPLRHRVLVIADEPDFQTLATYLSWLDCDTTGAGIVNVVDFVVDWKPDLVVLDPEVCGFEICRTIKTAVGAKTMVLMVTTLNELNDIERAVDAGTDDFISMPVSKNEFLKRVEDLLRVSRL